MEIIDRDTGEEHIHFIMAPLRDKSTSEDRRLKTVFHESFTLSRDAIRQVLVTFHHHRAGGVLRTTEDRENLLREETHLGTRYIKAMQQYAFGTGMLKSDYSLTPFGATVVNSDGLVEMRDTLWLMHYFLSAPHGPGPAFWHELVVTRFRTGDEFTNEEIAAQIAEFVTATEGKQLAERSVRSSANAFLGTYTKEEGLGRLGILQPVATNRYRVQEVDIPSAWAFAYALLDYWHAQFGELLTVNMDGLYGERDLTSLFLCGAGRLNMILRTMQREGFVDIYRVAPPYQVVLLRQDREPLLRKLYEHHESE